MKSAFELAMEKFDDDPVKKLTDKQKKELAEIDSRLQSKIAESEVMVDEKIKKSYGDVAAIEQFREDLAVEIASHREKAEKKKEAIRNS